MNCLPSFGTPNTLYQFKCNYCWSVFLHIPFCFSVIKLHKLNSIHVSGTALRLKSGMTIWFCYKRSKNFRVTLQILVPHYGHSKKVCYSQNSRSMYSKLLVLIQTQFWRHLVKHGTSEVWRENIFFSSIPRG